MYHTSQNYWRRRKKSVKTLAVALPKRKRPAVRLSLDRRVSDILAAAREIIDAKGFEGITISEIAARAGIVEGTVYRYFRNKDELLLKVAEIWFEERYSDHIDVSSLSGTYNKLRYLIWHSLTTIKDGPAFSRFVLTELRPQSDYKNSPIFEMNRVYTREIRALFHNAMECGEFSRDVSEQLLRDMIFGSIEHCTWRYLRGEGDFDPGKLADEIATVAYRGMAAHPSADDKLAEIVARLEQVAARLAPKG
jgi:TetR/AcrR family transcriptional regulator, fatty acid metabolism regulator protein